MKKNFTTVLLFLFLSSLIYSQQYQDVIYLKNGDIVKGVIIENVPDKYVKVEVTNGSIITLSYSNILKFTKEKKENVENEIIQPVQTYNQDEKLSEKSFQFSFGGRIGYFSPSEDAISEIYGSGLSFGISMFLFGAKQLGVDFSIDYFYKSGEPIIYDPNNIIDEGTAELTIIPITLTALYKIDTQGNITPFLGLGGGLYLYKEKIKLVAIDGTTASASLSENAFGYQAEAGIITSMSAKTSIFIGLRYSSATIEGEGGAGGNEVNAGGITLFAGILL